MNPSNQIDRARRKLDLHVATLNMYRPYLLGSYVARSRSSDHGPYMYTLQTVHVESVTTHVDLD